MDLNQLFQPAPDGYPRYKEGWGQTPRSIQDLFRQSGWLEKNSMLSAEEERKLKLQQMKINELLLMLEQRKQLEGPKGPYSPEDAGRYINSTGRWM